MISLYIVWIGFEMRVPRDKVAEMLTNVILDFLIGLIPIVGDIADFGFKANTKNLEIIQKYAPKIVHGEVI